MEGTALEGIVRFEQFIKDRLGLPTHMSEIGVENSDIDFLANVVTNNGTTTVGGEGPYKLDINDVKKSTKLQNKQMPKMPPLSSGAFFIYSGRCLLSASCQMAASVPPPFLRTSFS